MTSYEFEVAAKNAVIEVMKEREVDVNIKDLQLVWFAHIVGNKKCLIWGPQMMNNYAEVTYVQISDTIYVDLYEKIQHKEMLSFKADYQAHV